MLWHYQVVAVHVMNETQRSRWPDGSNGHTFLPVILEVGHERLSQPYADEAELIARLPAEARSALHNLGAVPLLVRLQYMNECHALNAAAAMALVRHARCTGAHWTVGGSHAEIGWRWGQCADGSSLSVLNYDPATGGQRTKHQAHAHQLMSVTTVAGARHVFDLSIAQFGSPASLQCVPQLVEHTAGCVHSPTLAARAAAGLAPALFAPLDSAESACAMPSCRLERGQAAVEAACDLVDSRGYARVGGFPLCEHTMPSPLFGPKREVGEVRPDDDLVEGGVLENLRKFERALKRL